MPCAAVGNLHCYLLEALLIVHLCHFRHQLLVVDIFLQRQQYLVGVDRFYEVVGNLFPYRLVHDVLLFALCHHNNRDVWLHLLDELQRLKPRQSGHHLVEQHEVEGVLLTLCHGVAAVTHSNHLVALLLKENDVGLEMVYLVVSPK